MAVQVVDFLGVHVKYEALLTYPTLRELAKHILHLLNTPEICPIGAMARKDTGVVNHTFSAQQSNLT